MIKMSEELNYEAISEEALKKLLKRAFELEEKARKAYDVAKGIKDKDIRNKARRNRDIVVAERVAIQDALTLKKGSRRSK
jgi:benzoyl-CoA reductase/2-hydroxyglutaryl-CoA dehydratase subunit BcrC/BadD/HgdB